MGTSYRINKTTGEKSLLYANPLQFENGKLYLYVEKDYKSYFAVSDDFGETWSTQKNMGISYWLNCQLTAITYPKKIDGKTAILFATPSSSSGRAAGKIFVGLVQDDGTLDWKYNYPYA